MCKRTNGKLYFLFVVTCFIMSLSGCATKKEAVNLEGEMQIHSIGELPEEQEAIFNKMLEGHIKPEPDKEGLAFVNDVEILWKGNYLFGDLDGDGIDECCLQILNDENNQFYILDYQDEQIWLLDVFDESQYKEIRFLRNGTLLLLTDEDEYLQKSWLETGEELCPVEVAEELVLKESTESIFLEEHSWNSIEDTLSEDFKIYFRNFKYDNLIGYRNGKVYWSNPDNAYNLYVSDENGENAQLLLAESVRSIYVEEDEIYFTNRADGYKLYCVYTVDEEWQGE